MSREVKLWGGIGEKKSNKKTQWYIQDRIYDSDGVCPALTNFKSDYWIIIRNGGKLKVKTLIEMLKKYNPDAECTLTTSEDITLSYICKDLDGNTFTKENTPIVFIEPVDECMQCVHEYMNGDVTWCSFYDKSCKDIDECYQFEEFKDYE